MNEHHNDFPLAYFITFTTYGTHVPGEGDEWVDRHHNRYDTLHLPSHSRLKCKVNALLAEPPFALDAVHRPLVLAAIQEACNFRGWQLEAAHIRPKHIHNVVAASADPEFVLGTFKSYSSRKLNRAGLDLGRGRRWTRGGSKRWLWTPESVEDAIRYVLEDQGPPSSVYRRQT